MSPDELSPMMIKRQQMPLVHHEVDLVLQVAAPSRGQQQLWRSKARLGCFIRLRGM